MPVWGSSLVPREQAEGPKVSISLSVWLDLGWEGAVLGFGHLKLNAIPAPAGKSIFSPFKVSPD